jgi:hypothetical protein
MGISSVTEDGTLADMVGARLPGANYEALYNKYLNRIPDIYRHDKGEYEDKITKEKILNDPEYTIDGTARKGGSSRIAVGSWM